MPVLGPESFRGRCSFGGGSPRLLPAQPFSKGDIGDPADSCNGAVQPPERLLPTPESSIATPSDFNMLGMCAHVNTRLRGARFDCSPPLPAPHCRYRLPPMADLFDPSPELAGPSRAEAPRPNRCSINRPHRPARLANALPEVRPVNSCTPLQSISAEPPVPRLSTSSIPRWRTSGPKIPRYSTRVPVEG